MVLIIFMIELVRQDHLQPNIERCLQCGVLRRRPGAVVDPVVACLSVCVGQNHPRVSAAPATTDLSDGAPKMVTGVVGEYMQRTVSEETVSDLREVRARRRFCTYGVKCVLNANRIHAPRR